ncbi:hypothetical protein IE984_10025 [Klebsiella pneumoniae]|nr:hypothetical protein [Klebsiella pneumoniae]
MNLNGNQWRFDTERRASIDDSERHKTSWTEKNYGWHDVKREWKKCEFRTAYPYFRGTSLHLAENGRLIAKQSYVGKEGAEERGRVRKLNFSFLIFFI